ncbi:hypothetical protein ACHAWF_017036 [Thalassiosira exigua]
MERRGRSRPPLDGSRVRKRERAMIASGRSTRGDGEGRRRGHGMGRNVAVVVLAVRFALPIGAGAAAYADAFVPSRLGRARCASGVQLRSAPLTRPPTPMLSMAPAAVSSTIDEAKAARIGGSTTRSNSTATNTKRYEIDKLSLIEKVENVPLGQLAQDHRRDMLTVMRQLSSMGRRRDDIIASNDGSYSRQRRQDAAMVEQLLDRLLREDGRQRQGDRDRDTVNARTYNLAIKAWANANVRGSAGNAERVLKRLKVADINAGEDRGSSRPDLYSFAYCYAAWHRESTFAASNAGNAKASSAAMRKAEAVLQSMKQVLMKGDGQHSRPFNFVEDVNALLVMWSNTNINSPDLLDKFLRYIAIESRGTNDIWLNSRSYNLVINAWAKSGNHKAQQRAEMLLKEMEEDNFVMPDLLSYSGVISCITKGKRLTDTDANNAEYLLHRMVAKRVQPDTVIFNQVLNIHSKKGSKGSAVRCEQLLDWMQELATEGNEQVSPDARTYNIILSAYANEIGAREAEIILDRLEGLGVANGVSYIVVMDAYAKGGDAHNSLQILSRMEKAFKDGNTEAKPTRRAYVSALNSLAKSGRGDAGTRAEALVQTMENAFKAGDSDLAPDTGVYNTLINCHKRSAERAEKVLYRMGKRDVVSYSSVINVYSKMGGVKAAKRAQALLDQMQEEDVEPNAHTFNSAITAWSRSGSKGAAQKAEGLLQKMEELYEAGNAELQPSAQVYTSVISAWAKSNEPGSALRAEVLLKLMWAMYKRGNKAVKPNTYTFTSVITAWARSGETEAGVRSEALLDQMIRLYEQDSDPDGKFCSGHRISSEASSPFSKHCLSLQQVKPNVQTFTSVINAYARARVRDAASKASDIMRKMEALGVRPNLQTYNVLISLWGNSQQQGAGKKAESILTKLEDEYIGGNKSMRPTAVSFTNCINAWARSSDFGKADRANALLNRMKERYASGIIAEPPNEFSYTAVINACATTYGEYGEKQDAFRIAYSVFKEMSESESLMPNHVTYSSFLRAISKLMPHGEKRDSMISAAFRLCVRDGQCDQNCLFHMKNGASPELISDLLQCSDHDEATRLKVEDLPFEWTHNVKKNTRGCIQ